MPYVESNSTDPMYYSFDWGNVHVCVHTPD